jgi:hypothetical protein
MHMYMHVYVYVDVYILMCVYVYTYMYTEQHHLRRTHASYTAHANTCTRWALSHIMHPEEEEEEEEEGLLLLVNKNTHTLGALANHASFGNLLWVDGSQHALHVYVYMPYVE